MASADIFHRGSKTFWKTRTHVDFLIVEHKDCDVLEIVCSNPATLQQAPRIYVRKSLLMNEICDDEIQARVIDMIDLIYERQKEFDRDILEKDAWRNAICEYIEERLELRQMLAGSKAFHVELRMPLFSEGFEETEVSFLCDAPASLVSYNLPGYAAPRGSTVQLARGASVAGAALSTLSARDRLRIPFVFIKVSKVMYLNNAEVRIWKLTASLILRDIEVHERQAIINLESTTLCAEFAARQCARMRSAAKIPASSNKYTRPPLLDTGSVGTVATEGSARYRDHRTKPSTPRFAEPKGNSSGSFKQGIDALASSFQRGLQSLGSSKQNMRPATTGGGRRPSRAAAVDQSNAGEGLTRKKSMVSMMMGGKTRRDSRIVHTTAAQRSPARNQQQRASKLISPRDLTPPASLSRSSADRNAAADTMGFGEDGNGSDRVSKVWFGGMSKKFSGLVSGKFSPFSGSSKYRTNRVGVSTDDSDVDADDALSLPQTLTTSSDSASGVQGDPAFVPVSGGFGSSFNNFISNISGKHTASTKGKVKSARDEGRGAASGTSASPVPVPATPSVPHARVTDSTLAPAPQIFQHITMWGGRVVIRPATSKTKRDIILRFK